MRRPPMPDISPLGPLLLQQPVEPLLHGRLIGAIVLVRFAGGEKCQQGQRRGGDVGIGRAGGAARIGPAMGCEPREAPTAVGVAMAIEPEQGGRDGSLAFDRPTAALRMIPLAAAGEARAGPAAARAVGISPSGADAAGAMHFRARSGGANIEAPHSETVRPGQIFSAPAGGNERAGVVDVLRQIAAQASAARASRRPIRLGRTRRGRRLDRAGPAGGEGSNWAASNETAPALRGRSTRIGVSQPNANSTTANSTMCVNMLAAYQGAVSRIQRPVSSIVS